MLPHIERSIELCRRVLELEKTVEPRQNLAKALYTRGQVAGRDGDQEMASKCFNECLDIREALATQDPGNYPKRLAVLEALARAGKHDPAAKLAEQLRSSHAKDAEFLVAVSRAYAQCSVAAADAAGLRQTYMQRAPADVKAALDLGFKDTFMLETDPDLDPVRSSPEFKKLMEGRGKPAGSTR